MLLRAFFTAGLIFSTVANPWASPADAVDFGKDVRPILSDHCFACHGPDEHDRQADMRLDTADGIATVVVAGDVSASDLVDRILTDDEDAIMPPPSFHKPLTAAQIKILTQWVEEGGTYQQHWAFTTPTKPVTSSASPIDELLIDAAKSAGLAPTDRADKRTLLRRVCLDLTGLPPTTQQRNEFLADDAKGSFERLVDRLLASPHYGRHMGRYWLDLVRYGDTHGLHLDNYREMWAYRDWVIESFNSNMTFDQFVTEQLAGDLLPDSTDAQKIASGFNRLNVTTSEGGSIYDEVFARNVMDRTDAFGTIFLGLTTGCAVCHDHKFDPITMRDYYSLSAFFNSLDGRALDGNAKDHPPVIKIISDDQKRELSDLATELASLADERFGPIPVVDAAQTRWESEIVSGHQPASSILTPTLATSSAGATMTIGSDDSAEVSGAIGEKDTIIIEADLPPGTVWQTLQLEALVDDAEGRVGLSSNGNVVLSEIVVETANANSAETWTAVPIAYGFADFEQPDGKFAVTYAFDGAVKPDEGWAVGGHQQTGGRTAWFVVPTLSSDEATKLRVTLKYESQFGKHQFRRVRLAVSDSVPAVPPAARLILSEIHAVGPFPFENENPAYTRKFGPQQKAFDASEVFAYEDREYRWQHRGDIRQIDIASLPVIADRLSALFIHQTITAPSPQKAELLIGTDDGVVVFLNDKQIGSSRGQKALVPLRNSYPLDLKQGVNEVLIKVVNHSNESELSYAYKSPAAGIPAGLVSVLERPVGGRSAAESQAIRRYYRQFHCLHPDWLALLDHEKGLKKYREELQSKLPTTLVWKETAEPREAKLLIRGQYDQPGDVVPRATPLFLPAMPADAPTDRLGLAHWLLAEDHPLTSRVAVNRFWQQLFGTGLVKTSEDFGSQGEQPSNLELLNLLAIEFRESGWDVKALMKKLVMTDAYQRSATVPAGSIAIDPENRLLARGARFRLDAEILRDQALAVSGLLVKSDGGPSVKPPQPAGLWNAVGYTNSDTANFKADTDERVYQRSVYIFWKRTSAPPQMSTLDAPSRESCTARRERTNTPLQALLMMNETQYFEAAKTMAASVSGDDHADGSKQTLDQKIADLFETVTVRPATDDELKELIHLWNDLYSHYAAAPDQAELLVDDDITGDENVNERSAARAAWTVLCSTLLNLDEVVTK